MTIQEILSGESKNIEFKENLPERSIKYMKSVVAFANGTGGKIIFGIADKTNEVVGFDKEDIFKKMDAIANAVSDSCEPAIIPDITLQTIEGKTIIVVEISEGRQRLYYSINIYRGQIESADDNRINKMLDINKKVPDTTDNMPDTDKKVPYNVDGVPDTIERLPDNEQMKHIYKYVLENGSITTARAAELLGVKQRRARAVLLDMVKKNYLKKEGAARSTIYKKNL